LPPTTCGLEMECDYSGRKGKDGQKKQKISKAKKSKKRINKKAKDEAVNGQGRQKGVPATRKVSEVGIFLFHVFPAITNHGTVQLIFTKQSCWPTRL